MRLREAEAQPASVLLPELAAALGDTNEGTAALVKRAGFEIQRDWLGRYVVPESVARQLVETQRREAEADALAYSRWETYRQARHQEVAEVEREALEAAAHEEGRRLGQRIRDLLPGASGQLLGLDYEGHARAQEKARKAVEKWHRLNPAKTVSDFRP